MVQTTKLGGSAKDIVVAKVGVRSSSPSLSCADADRIATPDRSHEDHVRVSFSTDASTLMLYFCRLTDKPAPEDEAFEMIKASIDITPAGSKMLLNSCTSKRQCVGYFRSNNPLQLSSTPTILAPGISNSWLASLRNTRGTLIRFSLV